MRLSRAFFARPCLEVAPALLGLVLVRELPDGTRLAGRIVEVEAYLGDGTDPGSHSHRGETRRNRTMFGPPGHFYVYVSMGIHVCANVVCEPAGRGAAVLLRALEPLEGESRMLVHRGGRGGRDLLRGPGRLAQALAITLADDGASVLSGALRLEAPRAPARLEIRSSTRIGLTKGVELPYRFFVAGSRLLSRAAGRTG